MEGHKQTHQVHNTDRRSFSNKMNYNKLFVLLLGALLVGLLSVSTASAFEFDNTYSFDQKTNTASIYNWFGLYHVADVQLISNTYFCTTDCEAVLKITPAKALNLEDTSTNTFSFKNIAKTRTIGVNSYSTFIQTGTDIVKTSVVTGKTCAAVSVNGTANCSPKYRTVDTEVPIWSPYTFTSDIASTEPFYIKLTGQKNATDNVDWVMKFYGVDINEFAPWSGYSSTADKTLFLKMNLAGAGTNVYDEVTAANYVFNAAPTWQQSDWGSAADWGKQTRQTLTTQYVDTLKQDGSTVFSIEFRVNLSAPPAGNEYLMSNGWTGAGCDATHYGFGIERNLSSGNLQFMTCNAQSNASYFGSTNTMATGSKHHIVFVYNATNALPNVADNKCKIYIDGALATGAWEWFDQCVQYVGASSSNLRLFNRPTGGKAFIGAFDQVIVWDRELTPAEVILANNSASNGGAIEGVYLTANLTGPTNALNTSTNSWNFTSESTVFNGNFSNITYYFWNATGPYNTTTLARTGMNVTNISRLEMVTMPDGSYNWTTQWCGINDTSTSCIYGDLSKNWTIKIGTQPPVLHFFYPNATIAYGKVGANITFNYSVISTGSTVDACRAIYGGVTSYINCTRNASIILAAGATNLTLWANDTFGNNATAETALDFIVFENSQSYNTSSYQTKYETFQINVTANSSLTQVQLVFNGTAFNATQTGELWKKNMDIPGTFSGNTSMYWNFTSGGLVIQSDSGYQYTTPIEFGLCNSTSLNQTYLNFTFKDESTDGYINGSIIAMPNSYYLGTGTEVKSFLFINVTEKPSYAFCFNPRDKTVISNISLFSYGATVSGYPQRNIVAPSYTLTNSTTNQILYLLSTSVGNYVTFQTVLTTGAPVSGVYVVAQRTIGALVATVAEGTTDAAGSVTFFLNPNFAHTITASHASYASVINTIIPTQALYTITMGSSASVWGNPNATLLDGITWGISPPSGIISGQNVNFSLAVWANYSNLQACDMNLRLLNGSVIASATGCGASGGVISIGYVNFSNDLYGAYRVRVNDSWIYLERDSHWVNITPSNDSWGGSFIGGFVGINNATELWGTDAQKADYNRIVVFFLLMAIILAALNFFTSFFLMFPGSSVYIMVAIIIFLNIASSGGLGVGPGYFYSEGATAYGAPIYNATGSLVSGSVAQNSWFNNWLIPAFSLLVLATTIIKHLKRDQ